MSKQRMLIAVDATVLVVSACIALMRWRATSFDAPQRAALAVPPAAHVPALDATPDDDVERLVANDPFRLSNTPSLVAYDASDVAGTPALVTLSRTPRPRLVLKAIVGGPPWQAIIDGLPGEGPGAVAEQGAVFDGLVIRAVARDSVVVQSPDTQWVLTFGGAP